MQSVNRVDAPSIFLRIENPRSGDIDLGKNIIANWSKNNNFVIPANFEVVEVGATVNDMALKTIAKVNTFFSSYFSPADFISTDGSLLGGSDEEKAELLGSFIGGIQGHIIDQFLPILQKILEYNGYIDYTVSIEFAERIFRNGTLDQLRAQGGAEVEAIDINEYRQFIGLPPKTPEEIEQMREDWKASKPQPTAVQSPDTTNDPTSSNQPNNKQTNEIQHKGGQPLTDENVQQKE